MQNKLNLFKACLSLFAISFLMMPICIGQTGGVRGHLTIKATGDSAIIKEHVMIWLKHDGEKWWITGVDSNFNFHYDFLKHNLKPDTTEIRITTIDKYKDTIVNNIILKENTETYIEIAYPPYCEYDKTKNDSICPICNKQDSVIRLIYDHYYGNRDVPKRKKAKKEYLIIHRVKFGCDPHWYCRRDKHDF